MGFFGKSEHELKVIAVDLDKRQTALDNREADINSKETTLAHERAVLAKDKHNFEDERSNHTEEYKHNANYIAAEKTKLRSSASKSPCSKQKPRRTSLTLSVMHS